jgi:putative hydrolase of the HAD superfamily
MIRYVLFDLDNTLYPPGVEVMRAITERILDYVTTHTNATRTEAEALQQRFYLELGSSLQPLARYYHLDLSDFMTYAHDVDVDALLQPDSDLDCLLGCIQAEKVIFTNAPRPYTERLLARLGVARHFSRIFDHAYSNFRGKPNPNVYARVQAALKVDGQDLFMVDDALQNLAPAHGLGWHTFWVGQAGTSPGISHDPAAEFMARDLWQIADVLHRLGAMDATHLAIAQHRMADCASAKSPYRPALVMPDLSLENERLVVDNKMRAHLRRRKLIFWPTRNGLKLPKMTSVPLPQRSS